MDLSAAGRLVRRLARPAAAEAEAAEAAAVPWAAALVGTPRLPWWVDGA